MKATRAFPKHIQKKAYIYNVLAKFVIDIYAHECQNVVSS